MRIHLSLDALRVRRRILLGLLTPLLMLQWVGVAALPCAAMGADTGLESSHVIMGHPTTVEASQHQGNAAYGAPDTSSHPACPHCAHAPDGSGDGGAAAHAGCGETPATALDDIRRQSARQDLGVAIPVVASLLAATRIVQVSAWSHPAGVPPPARALYLRHCVFLN